MIQVYHNNRYGKQSKAIKYLQNTAKEFEIIKYLENVPTFEALSKIIEKLDLKPIEVVRQKEKIWIENFKGKELSDVEIIKAMVSNPILIERPIVINNKKAVIARPFVKIESIL